jgi:hypothetical protein
MPGEKENRMENIKFNYSRCREALLYEVIEYNKKRTDSIAREKFKAVCEYARCCGVISYEGYAYLDEKIDLEEQVDPIRYES